MRKLLRKNAAEAGMLAAVVLVVGVMMAAIIGSIIFFAFSDGTEALQSTSEVFADTGVNNTVFWFKLQAWPDTTTPAWNATVTGTGTFYDDTAGNFTYAAGNNTVGVDSVLNWGNTSITLRFNTKAYGAVQSVATYAITVFAMVAIVPLILVGAVMLRSLGFMGGAGGKV